MQNEELTPELFEKARSAQSPEEIVALAKENGIENFTEETAKAFFARLHGSGELSDDELDNVAGGGFYSPDEQVKCLWCEGDDFQLDYELGGYRLYSCRKCGWCYHTFQD